MKRSIKITALLLSCIIVVGGCSDYLDKTPDEDLNLDDVFSQRNTTRNYMSNIYSSLPRGYMREPFTAASDEVEHGWDPAYPQNINNGSWSPAGNRNNRWSDWYQAIRKSNIFLNNIDGVPMPADEKEQWKGQVMFLRAYYHFLLMKMYGPIPLADKVFESGTDYTTLKRAPVEDLFNFILTELDKAGQILDMQTSDADRGEITRPAVMALRSKVLLYRASPLFNGNSDYQNFTNNAGEQVIPTQYDEGKWNEAAQAAKNAIDQLESAGFELYQSPDGDPFKSYRDLFLDGWNQEVILGRTRGDASHTEESTNPGSMGGSAQYQPTQNLVDAYETENGKQPILGYNSDGSPIINPDADYTEEGYVSEADAEGYYPPGISKMYANRDLRFYVSINFSGQLWKGQQLEFFFTGSDGQQAGNYPETGYLKRKYADPNVDIIRGIYTQKTWPLFRLGEIYLNYAEALNEAEGPVADVYEYVNRVRNRAGMPDLPEGLSQEEMRERIRHERRIELAFENHRYFDTHRWKIADETQAGPIYGMDTDEGQSLQDDAYYSRVVLEERLFEAPKHYLWPIPVNEIEKTNIVQNPGW